MNEHVCLGLPTLEESKTVTYKFWYDCVKPIVLLSM